MPPSLSDEQQEADRQATERDQYPQMQDDLLELFVRHRGLIQVTAAAHFTR